MKNISPYCKYSWKCNGCKCNYAVRTTGLCSFSNFDRSPWRGKNYHNLAISRNKQPLSILPTGSRQCVCWVLSPPNNIVWYKQGHLIEKLYFSPLTQWILCQQNPWLHTDTVYSTLIQSLSVHCTANCQSPQYGKLKCYQPHLYIALLDFS